MIKRGVQHIRHNAVAYVSLFFALSGASYATWLAPANSVNSQAIIDGQVTTPDLAQNAIRADEHCSLYFGCIGSKEIASGAVASSEIAPGAVGNSQLANASVNSQKIVLGSILSNRIAPRAIGTDQLAPDAVTGAKVKDGSLTAADIAGGIPQAEAYIARNDYSQTISGKGATVVSVNLPPGYYALTANTDLYNWDGASQLAECTLSTGASEEPYIPSGGYQQIYVADLLTLTSPGTASLHCSTYSGESIGARLIAIKVAALHG
jgi:hypothetical protein